MSGDLFLDFALERVYPSDLPDGERADRWAELIEQRDHDEAARRYEDRIYRTFSVSHAVGDRPRIHWTVR